MTEQRINRSPGDDDRSSHGSTLRDVMRFFFRRRRLLLTVWFGVVGLVILLVYLLPPQYEASATVLIERGKQPTLRSDPLHFPLEMFEVMASEMQIIKSVGVAEGVVDRLNLHERPVRQSDLQRLKASIRDALDRWGLLTKLDRRDALIQDIQRKLIVEQPPQSATLQIMFRHEDPEHAARIVEAATAIYLKRHRQIFAENTVEFFADRLEQVKRQLEALRKADVRATDPVRKRQLELEVAALDRSFLFFHEKWNQATAERAADPSLVNVRLVDPAQVPTRPRFARLTLIILSVPAGLLLGIGLALISHYFDHRVYEPDDLPANSAAPVLGTLRRSRAARLLNRPRSWVT